MKILETKTITMTESLGLLSNEDEENMGYEQKITLDYLRRHTFLTEKDVLSAKKELEQISGLKEHQITALIDMLPETEEDVKIVFMKERINVEKEQINKILDALAKIRPDQKKIKAKRTAVKKAVKKIEEEKLNDKIEETVAFEEKSIEKTKKSE